VTFDSIPGTGGERPSGTAVIAGVVAVAAFATAAVLFIGSSSDALQRLALLFGLLGLFAPALAGLLRADAAAARVDGHLDDRIQAAVERAHHAVDHPTPTPDDPLPGALP
jgi:hypothetical protein